MPARPAFHGCWEDQPNSSFWSVCQVHSFLSLHPLTVHVTPWRCVIEVNPFPCRVPVIYWDGLASGSRVCSWTFAVPSDFGSVSLGGEKSADWKMQTPEGRGGHKSPPERDVVFGEAAGRKDACWAVIQCVTVVWMILFSFLRSTMNLASGNRPGLYCKEMKLPQNQRSQYLGMWYSQQEVRRRGKIPQTKGALAKSHTGSLGGHREGKRSRSSWLHERENLPDLKLHTSLKVNFWRGWSRVHIWVLRVGTPWCASWGFISALSSPSGRLWGPCGSGPVYPAIGAFCSWETKDNFSDIWVITTFF